MPLRHVLAFRKRNQTFRLIDERIENEKSYPHHDDPYFYYNYNDGNPVINIKTEGQEDKPERRKLKPETVDIDQSILAQRREPETYPEISYLANVYDKIKIYREWYFGRNAVFREPQKADMRNDRLEEDFSNLGLFLNRLRGVPKAKKRFLKRFVTSMKALTISMLASKVELSRYSLPKGILQSLQPGYRTELCDTFVCWRSCVIQPLRRSSVSRSRNLVFIPIFYPK